MKGGRRLFGVQISEMIGRRLSASSSSVIASEAPAGTQLTAPVP
jgi:hypothetical protein